MLDLMQTSIYSAFLSIFSLGNNLVYFSMIYMSGFGVLHGDRYLNFFLNGILEVPRMSAVHCMPSPVRIGHYFNHFNYFNLQYTNCPSLHTVISHCSVRMHFFNHAPYILCKHMDDKSGQCMSLILD